MQELTTTQTIAYYGMIVCVALGFGLIVLENFFLKKQVKAQRDLIQDMRSALKSGDDLIKALRVTNTEYLSVLRQIGLVKEEEKPRLDG